MVVRMNILCLHHGLRLDNFTVMPNNIHDFHSIVCIHNLGHIVEASGLPSPQLPTKAGSTGSTNIDGSLVAFV